jgi:hypothetical protein
MPIGRYFRKVAPFWDKYDTVFTAVLSGIIILGYATFVEQISLSGLFAAWAPFIENSGILVLLTAWTAIIGLYRLRHRPDKTRAAVHEDFRSLDQEGAIDFGLRNFGPGPALYLQALITVEQEQEQVEVARFQVHDPPIHLREGDFASLVSATEDDWVSEMAQKYKIGQSKEKGDRNQGTPPRVNLYYSYVSQSGARTPTDITSERDDTDLLDRIKDPDVDARRIELSRIVETC